MKCLAVMWLRRLWRRWRRRHPSHYYPLIYRRADAPGDDAEAARPDPVRARDDMNESRNARLGSEEPDLANGKA